jgi:hypothetical protein
MKASKLPYLGGGGGVSKILTEKINIVCQILWVSLPCLPWLCAANVVEDCHISQADGNMVRLYHTHSRVSVSIGMESRWTLAYCSIHSCGICTMYLTTPNVLTMHAFAPCYQYNLNWHLVQHKHAISLLNSEVMVEFLMHLFTMASDGKPYFPLLDDTNYSEWSMQMEAKCQGNSPWLIFLYIPYSLSFPFYSLFSILSCHILTGSISIDCDHYGHSHVM